MDATNSTYADLYTNLTPSTKRKWTLKEFVEFCENWDETRKYILEVGK